MKPYCKSDSNHGIVASEYDSYNRAAKDRNRDTAMSSPYFFLSYARGDDFTLEQARGEAATGPIRTFYERLALALAKLTGSFRAPWDPQDHGFFDTNIKLGELWENDLRKGLERADVLVCAYSPQYFRRPNCGKEVQAFLDRCAAIAPGVTPPILPVAYLPQNLPSPLPANFGKYELENVTVPPVYRDRGLDGLLLENDSEQQKFAALLADQILRLSERRPIRGAYAIPEYSKLENAFSKKLRGLSQPQVDELLAALLLGITDPLDLSQLAAIRQSAKLSFPQFAGFERLELDELVQTVGGFGRSDVLDFATTLVHSEDLRLPPEAFKRLRDWHESLKVDSAGSSPPPIKLEDEDSPRWVTYFVRSYLKDGSNRFELSKLRWDAPFKNAKPLMEPVEFEKPEDVKAQIANWVAKCREHNSAGGQLFVEFCVPLSFFDYEFEKLPSPWRPNQQLAHEFPVVRRPVDFWEDGQRRHLLKNKLSASGIEFVDDPQYSKLLPKYRQDMSMGHVCVGLVLEPKFGLEPGVGDLFDAILRNGMPSMLWFRGLKKKDQAAGKEFARQFLANATWKDFPLRVFQQRQRALAEDRLALSEVILVVDGPERVPVQLRTNEAQ